MAISGWGRTDMTPENGQWWVCTPFDIRWQAVATHADAVAHLDNGAGEIRRNPNKEAYFYRNYDDGTPAVEVKSVELDAQEQGLMAVPNAKYDFWWDAVPQ